MKNQTKFRAKGIRTREWIEGDLIHNSKGNPCIVLSWHQSGLKSRFIMVEPNTVGQFTGLKDKNGKEIFEGDIIKCVSPNDPTQVYETGFNCSLVSGISFNNPSMIQDSVLFEWELPLKMEVVNNIHDNPELLEK